MEAEAGRTVNVLIMLGVLACVAAIIYMLVVLFCPEKF
jgi:hypothetical protein